MAQRIRVGGGRGAQIVNYAWDPAGAVTTHSRSDNVNGVDFQSASIFAPYVWIGPIEVDRLSLSYNEDQDSWSGGATVHLLPGAPGIDASPPPPDLGFGIRNGAFDHAGSGLDFGPATQPQLFPGIFLTNIHVSIGVDPLRFTRGIGITAGQIVDINGDVYVAFATPDQQYIFPASGGDLSPLSRSTLNSFTIAVGGTRPCTCRSWGAPAR